MRNLLLTVVIACAIIATWGLADGYTSTTGNLAAVETSTAVFDHQGRPEETNQLDGRVRGVYGNLRVPGRCEGCTSITGTATTGDARYAGLTPSRNASPYEGITGEAGVYENLTLRHIGAQEEVVIIEAGDSTPVTKKIRATPVVQVAEHECDCGKGRVCKCPPLVCEGSYCTTNYAIVFSSKTCRVCPQMWPVIQQLREDGYIVFYAETDKHPGVLERLGIQVWPTTIVMENKRPKVRFRGVTTAEKIAAHLKTQKEQGLTNDKGKP